MIQVILAKHHARGVVVRMLLQPLQEYAIRIRRTAIVEGQECLEHQRLGVIEFQPTLVSLGGFGIELLRHVEIAFQSPTVGFGALLRLHPVSQCECSGHIVVLQLQKRQKNRRLRVIRRRFMHLVQIRFSST